MSQGGSSLAGEVIGGKYRVERLLGEGGMGRVLLARHAMTRKLVALKFLRDDLVQIPEAAGRFMNEARAAVQIESEHVAKVLDVDVLPSGAPYMVMEYLEGEDLAALLLRERRLSPERAVEYVLEACIAIAEAHALGIVHRDLKPSNLFLTKRKDGTTIVKVLDFGIAKALAPTESGTAIAHTRAGGVVGSPPYMSPEQLTAPDKIDVRTDVWSIGVVLYELLSGVVPFAGEPLSVQIIQIVQAPHAPLSRAVPGIAPLLSAVVDRCLCKDSGRRFSSIADFAEALTPAATLTGQLNARRTRAMLSSSARPDLASAPGIRVAVPGDADADAPTILHEAGLAPRRATAAIPGAAATTGARWGSTSEGSGEPQAGGAARRRTMVGAALGGLAAIAAVVLRLTRTPELPVTSFAASAPLAPSTSAPASAVAPVPVSTLTSSTSMPGLTPVDIDALSDARPPPGKNAGAGGAKGKVALKEPAKDVPKDPPKTKPPAGWGSQHLCDLSVLVLRS